PASHPSHHISLTRRSSDLLSGKLSETGARYKVDVNILKDRAVLTIDTSGDALHKRGYRREQGEAPIKETLAASMLRLANYDGTKDRKSTRLNSSHVSISSS